MDYIYRGYDVPHARGYLEAYRRGYVCLVYQADVADGLIDYLEKYAVKTSQIDMYAFANALYIHGDLKQKHKAFKIICDLVDEGFIPAYNQYGVVLHDGVCVDKDVMGAVRMFEKAAQGGFMIAKYHLGYCYINGIGYKKDVAKGMELMEECAFQELDRATHALAISYYKGVNGYPMNKAEAFRYFREAAYNGHVKSLYMLANMFLDGEGCTADAERALNNFKLAAVFGHEKSQLMAGRMLCFGQGVARNVDQGRYFLEMAAENGSEEAKELLKRI